MSTFVPKSPPDKAQELVYDAWEAKTAKRRVSLAEKAWSKLKSLLKDAKARTQEALYRAIARAIELLTPADAEAWFRHCGFEVGFA